MTVIAWSINDKLYFINIRNFCSVKSIVKRIEREDRDSEKIFANYTSDKRLISRINIYIYIYIISM